MSKEEIVKDIRFLRYASVKINLAKNILFDRTYTILDKKQLN